MRDQTGAALIVVSERWVVCRCSNIGEIYRTLSLVADTNTTSLIFIGGSNNRSIDEHIIIAAWTDVRHHQTWNRNVIKQCHEYLQIGILHLRIFASCGVLVDKHCTALQ